MASVVPFRALRPVPELAARVIAPPYDVLTDEEVEALAVDPCSFVHVTRSEADLPPGTDPHSDEAYAKARENLDKLRRDGAFLYEDRPAFYVYAQRMGDHAQAGFLLGCAVDEYDDGRIRRHELTRPDKEDDRTRHMEALDAQVGLVFLTYKAHPGLADVLAQVTATPPAWQVTTEDAVEHRFWVVPATLDAAVQAGFAELDALYVADGHHRSAAASRVHRQRGDAESAWFLAGLFPDDHLRILAYNRVVFDAPPPATLLAQLAQDFAVSPGEPVPSRAGTFSMYLDGAWYRLEPRSDRVRPADPVAALDVSILQDHVLAPLLGIADPRRSEKIQFVGGIRGPQALVAAVDAHPGAVAFHLYPTSLAQLFDVADAGQIMPPKSTWFEPKLREGVVVRLLSGG